MNIHERYMRLAIELAKKAEGKTSPNPLVGAVIVRNNRIIGKGYHKRCGLPHAEINALRSCRGKAKGATLYVTLEPCDHYGMTGPCTDVIINSGIKKVVIAMRDPNPINNGRGIARLRKAGIKVGTGLLAEEAWAINRPYIKYITKGVPYITVKVAQSLDGKIATKTGDSKWISSEDSRRYVHELRGKVDAIMVGARTVLRDNPLLLNKVSQKQPVRIVVAGNSRIPKSARIFSDTDRSPVIIAKSLSEALTRKNMMHVLVEGGGELIASLMEKGLVDELLIFIAPKIIGGAEAKTAVEGAGISRMKDALGFKIKSVKRFNKDILIEAERS